MAVSMLIEKTSRGKASLNRVRELLGAEINVSDAPGAVDIGSVKGKIEMRNLNFRYPDGEFDVLRNVSFTIEPGENVGIVGKTGAGKTTLVGFVRFIECKGDIVCDRVREKEIVLRNIRTVSLTERHQPSPPLNGRRSLRMLTITLLSLKTDRKGN